MHGDKFIATVEKCVLNVGDDATKIRLGVLFSVDDNGTTEQVWGQIYFTPKAMGIARKSLKAIGFDPDRQTLDEFQRDQALCKGKRAEIEIEDHEYKGETTLRVKWINPLPKPVDENTLSNLTKALRAVKKKDAEEEMPTPPEEVGEDIPF